ncbi:pantoate--beta-alanine ligase [Salinibacter sp. 10B]|uniref:pantoate--beta-alanine ligase n=1 Tax=Salinibacter sp. 10B TaxID=1923971 RepID=UPI000CF567EC|nr:pantoate--beta-alanine ligase [Salinibacter sp. 10B]PQJ35807.1 pantoate--beta-alanine ligase [Salinibacter sp. 10B]
MDLIRTVDGMQDHADVARSKGQTLALVPTLGALHEGHLALVRRALKEADHVTVSVFVNPTQFGPDEDYDEYPRDLEGDRDKLEALGVDVLFAPSVAEMYPYADDEALAGPLSWVEVEHLDQHLCGAYREGHFRGVTTVVTKLFHACKPDIGVFGKKDAQQYVILKHLVEDLLLDIDIVGVPTVREADGLAQSSRNAYLSETEREQATVLYDAVSAAEEAIQGGEQDAQAVVRAMDNILVTAPDGEVEYAEVVDAHTLQPVEHLAPGQDVLAAVAVYFGETRLIDNAFVEVPSA